MPAEPPSKSPRAAKAKSFDELLASAADAIKRQDAFEADRLASRALREAHGRRDYRAIPRVLPVLQSAREIILKSALGENTIVRLDEVREDEPLAPGVWMVEPPAVGADARNLRARAHEARVPVLAFAREPQTRAGLCPVVVIGPATIRARIDPPKNDEPTIAWVEGALASLVDAALLGVDATTVETRVSQLIDRIETLPEGFALYDRLATMCEEAAAFVDEAERRRRKPRDADAPGNAGDAEDDNDSQD